MRAPFVDLIFARINTSEIPEMSTESLQRHSALVDRICQEFKDTWNADEAWDVVERNAENLQELCDNLRKEGAKSVSNPQEIELRIRERDRLFKRVMQLPRTPSISLDKMHPRFRQVSIEVELLFPLLFAFHLLRWNAETAKEWDVVGHVEAAILEGLDNILGVFLGVMPEETLDSNLTIKPLIPSEMNAAWHRYKARLCSSSSAPS